MISNRCPRLVFACVVMAIAGGCVTEPSTRSSDDPLFVSLMSEPNVYDGRQIEISGYLILESEARQLWSSKAASERGSGRTDCLTLTNTDAVLGRTTNVHRKVTVTGVFRKNITPPGVVDLGSCNERGIELLSVAR